MKKILGIASAAMLTIGIAGCSNADSSTEVPSTLRPSSASPATPEYDALAACDIMIGGDSGGDGVILVAPELILSIGSQMTAEQTNQMLDLDEKIKEAAKLAPPEMASYFTEFGIPFAQLADAKNGDGGELTLDTGHVKEAVPKIVDACSEAGYEVENFAELSEITEQQIDPTPRDEQKYLQNVRITNTSAQYLSDADLIDAGDATCAQFDNDGNPANVLDYMYEKDAESMNRFGLSIAAQASMWLCSRHGLAVANYVLEHDDVQVTGGVYGDGN